MTATITVHGGLVAPPELKFTNSGKALVSGTVASTERYLDKRTNEWVDGKKLYARFTAWGELAENIAASGLDKGTQVAITGKLFTHEFQDKDGNKRSSTELELSYFAVSLKKATATVARAQKQGSGASGGAGWHSDTSVGQNGPQNGFGDTGGFGDADGFGSPF